MLLFACEEKVTYPIYDADQLRAYVENSDQGQMLFGTDLIPGTPYQLADNGVVYRDSVDSIVRVYVADTISGEGKDWSAEPGLKQYLIMAYAEVIVRDDFYGRTVRAAGDDTSYIPFKITTTRRGFFLRLGNNLYNNYNGWMVFAFLGGDYFQSVTLNEVDGPRVNVYPSAFHYRVLDSVWNDALNRWDITPRVRAIKQEYIPLEENLGGVEGITPITKGRAIAFHSQEPYIIAVAGETDSGLGWHLLDRYTGSKWVDTIKTPTVNEKAFNLMCVQKFAGEQRVGGMWCIPYHAR